jgi:hypothetical protein
MSWHPDHTVLDRYALGLAGEVTASSVEAHLVVCRLCRSSVGGAVDVVRKERIWAGVREVTETPLTRRGEGVLRRLGVPGAWARLLAMTPSVRTSWLLSVMVVLAMALLAPRSARGGSLVFLLLAPLVPVAGVAVSFGRRVDPVYEVALATATGGFRLMLVRVVAVLTASAVVVAVPAIVRAEFRWAAVWLIPALAVTVLTLVLSTVTSTSVAAGLVSVLWLASVSVLAVSPTPEVILQLSGQAFLSCLAAVLVAVLLARRQAFERL